jgi:hypothetical protein
MGKILVRKMTLNGDFPNSASENSDFPAYWDVRETRRKIEEFLHANAQLVTEQAQAPFVRDGFVGDFVAFSCYTFNNCLLTNEFMPFFYSEEHRIKIASLLEDRSKLEATLSLLKEEAGGRWAKYWDDRWKETIIDVSEGLPGPVSCLPYFKEFSQK